MRNFAIGSCVVLCLVLTAAWLVPAQGQEKPKTETPKTVTVSVADIDAAAKAVAEANAALSANNKKEAMEKLAEAAKLLAKMKAAATAGAAATTLPAGGAAAGGADTYTGAVEATMSQKRPRLVVGGTHYELKASDKADAGVKDTLAKISKGEATGKYTVKGAVSNIEGRTWLVVDSITKATD